MELVRSLRDLGYSRFVDTGSRSLLCSGQCPSLPFQLLAAPICRNIPVTMCGRRQVCPLDCGNISVGNRRRRSGLVIVLGNEPSSAPPFSNRAVTHELETIEFGREFENNCPSDSLCLPLIFHAQSHTSRANALGVLGVRIRGLNQGWLTNSRN